MKKNEADLRFKKFILNRKVRIQKVLADYLKSTTKGAPKVLSDAMQYAVLNGGKRLRALLIYAVGKAYGAKVRSLDRAAGAIEMIHAFSLVHDDLPAMDDDELRRGKPTCHIAFDEATAILVGDALSVLAFQILSEDSLLSSKKKVEMIKVLAEASGPKGIAGGQYLDMNMPRKPTKDLLKKMYLLKTGSLISAAIKFGALASNVSKKDLKKLEQFADKIGFAFQIKDDILNIEGDVKKLGKNTGTDKAQNKTTYPMLVGISKAKTKLKKLYKESNEILKELKIETSFLGFLAQTIMDRES